MRLSRKFYSRDTKIIAKELLGKVLVHRTKEGLLKGKIVETEAYLGRGDPGARGGRNINRAPASLLKEPGHAFVYFTYGNHWMLNVVAKNPGVLGAVLIRAVEPMQGIKLMKRWRGKGDIKDLTTGPGKLTQAFGIDKSHDGLDLTSGDLFIEDSEDKPKIFTTTRIGLSRGGDLPLRFYIEGNGFVSRK